MTSKIERWGWLYGTEAYNNIESNLLTLDQSVLLDCLVEFREYHWRRAANFTGRYVDFTWRYIDNTVEDSAVLVAKLWPLIDELARYDDGGYAVHLCPYGCPSHKMILE